MIRPEDVFCIGHVSKHRGLQGEVEIAFTDDCFDTGESPYLVLDMEGILVPFFWEEYSFKNQDTAIFKFEEVDNETEARHLTGHRVFYPKSRVNSDEAESTQATLSSYRALTGFTIYASDQSLLGTVTHVDDTSANVLLTLEQPDGKETIIPFHNDFLVHFDLRERTLQLELPEGIIELNG